MEQLREVYVVKDERSKSPITDYATLSGAYGLLYSGTYEKAQKRVTIINRSRGAEALSIVGSVQLPMVLGVANVYLFAYGKNKKADVEVAEYEAMPRLNIKSALLRATQKAKEMGVGYHAFYLGEANEED